MMKNLILVLFFIPLLVLSQQWSPIMTSNYHQRDENWLVNIGNEIILGGGSSNNFEIEVLDLSTKMWTTKVTPSPYKEINHVQAQVWNSQVILAGGWQNNCWNRCIPQDSIWSYTPSTNSWDNMFHIPFTRRRGSTATALIGNELYILGGSFGHGTTSAVAWVDKINLLTGQWDTLQPMNWNRDHFQASVHNGKIYVMGGTEGNTNTANSFRPAVEEYDPFFNTWTVVNNMPVSKAEFQMVEAFGRIVITGGVTGCQQTQCIQSSTEYYDPASNNWSYGFNMLLPRAGTGMALVNDSIYIASGSASWASNFVEVLPTFIPLGIPTPDTVTGLHFGPTDIHYSNGTVFNPNKQYLRILTNTGSRLYLGSDPTIDITGASGMYTVQTLDENTIKTIKFIHTSW